MKKSNLLNAPLSATIATMGHTDGLVIADAGLPIPETTQRIDLAVCKDLPRFLPVLETTLSELSVECVVIAEEMKTHNREIHKALLNLLSTHGISQITYYTHEDFKVLAGKSRAIVRTGECSPYANILLYSGVTF